MSGLSEKIWAVLSERGIESKDMTYEAAYAMVLRLRSEDVHGLCVITTAAASRYSSQPEQRAEPELQQVAE